MDMPGVALHSARGRWIVTATVLGSSLAMLDSTVVTIALPAIGRDLHADIAGLQWVLSGYTLTVAALILVGGSLSDRLGRRRVFVWGTVWFALASVACGAAVNLEMLVAARLLQGVGAALLTPGSLAIISATIREDDRGAAIGLWSGLGGVASAAGPLLGGWLVEAVGWRTVFLINLPLAALVVWVASRHVPETRDPHPPARLDVPGAVVGALGLAAVTYGSIESQPIAVGAGLVVLVAFVVVERRSPVALVPPGLFRSRVFTGANIMTFAVYAALGGFFFLVVVQLQIVSGYAPLAAGLATIPVTILMLSFSATSGAFAQRHGPRLQMTVGPIVAAAGVLLISRVGRDASYLVDVLPGMIVFGIGLTTLVAPLTAAVLGAVPTEQSGVASGVNNAIARTSQLLAVAALPGIAGISSGALDDPVVFGSGFRTAMYVCAGLLVVGGVVAAVLVRPTRTPATDSESVVGKPHCDITGPAVHPPTHP